MRVKENGVDTFNEKSIIVRINETIELLDHCKDYRVIKILERNLKSYKAIRKLLEE